jgi:hypothetical protein
MHAAAYVGDAECIRALIQAGKLFVQIMLIVKSYCPFMEYL